MSDKLPTNMDPQTAALLRRAFRTLNRFMLLMWRLDMAGWFTITPRLSGQIMVLLHTGRKSGLPRRTPLNYALVAGELYCTAGFGHVAHWYRNIQANPQVEVWLPDGRWRGEAADVTNRADALDVLRQVLIGSGFAAFAAGINPYQMSDADLAAATQGYRVVHIRRTAAVTGPGGPGDLRWVWQVATFILLPLLLRRRR
jgi:deazaflavin-dependent oxidoreductase (nitroreductase family)